MMKPNMNVYSESCPAITAGLVISAGMIGVCYAFGYDSGKHNCKACNVCDDDNEYWYHDDAEIK